MDLKLISTIIIICLTYKSMYSQRHGDYSSSPILSKYCVDYIYNRALDLTLKDKRLTLSPIGIFYIDDPDTFTTIKITIDPNPSTNAFKSMYVPEVDSLKLKIYSCQDSPINQSNIINSLEIEFKHFDIIPTLSENHLAHFIFSPIYFNNDRIFVGVHAINQFSTTNGKINYDTYVIYEAEKCPYNVIRFHKSYIPIGFNLVGAKTHATFMIEDRSCSYD